MLTELFRFEESETEVALLVELYNATDEPIDLRGVRLVSESGACSETCTEIVVEGSAPIWIAPAGRAVLGNVSDVRIDSAFVFGQSDLLVPSGGARLRLESDGGVPLDTVCFGLPCAARSCPDPRVACVLGECVPSGRVTASGPGGGGGCPARYCMRFPDCPDCPEASTQDLRCGEYYCWGEDTVFPPGHSIVFDDLRGPPDHLANDSLNAWAVGAPSLGASLVEELECPEPRCGDGVWAPGAGEECDHGEANSDSEPGACRTDCSLPFCDGGEGDSGDGVLSGAEVVFTEFMRGPCDMSDSDGEWIELLNVSDEAVCLEGWMVVVDNKSHTLAASKDAPGLLTLEPGEYLALARSADALRLEAFYVYRGLTLGGDHDVLTLVDGTGAVVDAVAFEEGWPDVGCASVQLSSDRLTAADNDLAPNWCPGTTVYGTDHDMGTPGAANGLCLPCGNGVEDDGESCDDGTQNSDTTPNACREDCTLPRCGDGVVDDGEGFGETCDAGDGVNSDTEPNTCRVDCREPYCGDGVVDDELRYGEQCDGAEGCDDACRWILPTCPPPPGGLIITEIMRDPNGAGDAGEWIELHNAGAEEYGLHCCSIIDGPDPEYHAHVLVAANVEPGGSLAVGPGEYWVIARRGAEDGSPASPDYVFSISLGNTCDSVAIVCAGFEVDRVDYCDSDGWPDGAGRSMALSPDAFDVGANDNAESWCAAGDDSLYDDRSGDCGTPGAENPACPPLVPSWCRLQWPREAVSMVGESVTIWGLVWEPGVTDLTSVVDEGVIAGQVGYGPDGSDPSGDGWSWTDATPSESWDDRSGAEPGNDEYEATLAVPAPGVYDHAFRFSMDGGAHWLYCDGYAGEGSDGSEDGYQPENAGSLTTYGDPCEPNPCTAPLIAPGCAGDGVTAVGWQAPGVCSLEAGQAVCNYEEWRVDCSAYGRICYDGRCVWPEPQPGAFVFTELMVNPDCGLTDADGEWLELFNTTLDRLSLEGCSLREPSGDRPLGAVTVEPRSYALFARSAEPERNGGLATGGAGVPFSLGNGGDSIALVCEGIVIDEVSYAPEDGWPLESGRAMALHPAAIDSRMNDQSTNWYAATTPYHGEPDGCANYGTPGGPSPTPDAAGGTDE